jgi:hypothetical protein
MTLIHSLLCQKYEVLSTKVENRMNIIDIIKRIYLAFEC